MKKITLAAILLLLFAGYSAAKKVTVPARQRYIYFQDPWL